MTNNLHTTISLVALLLALPSCKWLTPDNPIDETLPPPGSAQFDYWIHSPLHPANGEAVTFKAKIKEPTGLKKAELFVYEYELFKEEDGLPSKRRRTGGTWNSVRSWNFNGEKTATLSHRYTKGFPKASQVEYRFVVTDTDGRITQKMALFDAGDSPWPTDKILLYSTTHQPLSSTLNLCFFPDRDFQRNWKAFLDDTHKMIFDGFHQSNIIKDRKERWTFFYTQQDADGLNIALDFTNPDHYPDFMKEDLITGIDAFALLHKTPYSDGSYMYGNIHFLHNNVFTSESYNPGTAIHEMGHAVFQLSDEYDGCACFEPIDGFSNVFSNEEDCLAFHRKNGQANGTCHEYFGIDGSRWYTPEDYVYFPTMDACTDYNKSKGQPDRQCITFIQPDGTRSYRAEAGVCIMADDGDNNIYPFQDVCLAVVEDYYSRFGEELLATTSGGGALSPGEAHPLRENMYGYEPVVLLELEENAIGFWNADIRKITYGIPEKSNRKGNAANITFTTKTDRVTYQSQLNHPGEGHFCGGRLGGQTIQTDVSKCQLTIPYTPDLREMIIEPHNRGRLTPKGIGHQVINIEKQMEKAWKDFEN